MKIKSNKEEPKFQPITIPITLESKEELYTLKEMSYRNRSIPDLFPHDVRPIIVDFLDQLGYEIHIE